MMRKDRRLAFIFLCPLALSILLFQLYPIFLNGFYSLLNWNGLTKTANFIGLDNYIQLFEDSLFWNAVGNSLLFAVLGTILQVGISFGLAALCEFAGFKRETGSGCFSFCRLQQPVRSSGLYSKRSSPMKDLSMA